MGDKHYSLALWLTSRLYSKYVCYVCLQQPTWRITCWPWSGRLEVCRRKFGFLCESRTRSYRWVVYILCSQKSFRMVRRCTFIENSQRQRVMQCWADEHWEFIGMSFRRKICEAEIAHCTDGGATVVNDAEYINSAKFKWIGRLWFCQRRESVWRACHSVAFFLCRHSMCMLSVIFSWYLVFVDW